MSKKKSQVERRPVDELSYEEAVAELESINERIEQGTIGLEESLEEYRRGMELAKRCNAILDVAEQDVKKIRPGEAREGDDSGRK